MMGSTGSLPSIKYVGYGAAGAGIGGTRCMVFQLPFRAFLVGRHRVAMRKVVTGSMMYANIVFAKRKLIRGVYYDGLIRLDENLPGRLSLAVDQPHFVERE